MDGSAYFCYLLRYSLGTYQMRDGCLNCLLECQAEDNAVQPEGVFVDNLIAGHYRRVRTRGTTLWLNYWSLASTFLFFGFADL